MFLIEEFKKFHKGKYLSLEEYLNLGIRLREEGFSEKAVKIHKSLLAIPNLKKENERQIKKELGFDYMDMGDYKNALKYLVEANKLYKGKEKPLKEKLLYAFEKNRLWEEAADLKKNILTQEKKFTEKTFSFYLSKIGEILYFEGDYKRAKDFFIKSIKTYPNNPVVYFYLAEMEKNKNKKLEYYKKALEIDGNMKKMVYERVKTLLFEEKDYEAFHKFLEQEDDELAKCYLAEYLFQKGSEEDSERILRELNSSEEEVNKKGLEIAILLKNISLIEKFSKGLSNSKAKEYECRICGYTSNNHRFFCPECEGEFSFIRT